MTQGQTFKRRIFLINKNFQFAYIGKILFLEFIAVFTTALLVSYLFLFVFNDSAMVSTGPWGFGILWSTIFLILVLMVVLIWLGIRVSHRIAGPMYRFERSFDEVSNENYSVRIHLREKDEMKPLAVAFNSMMDKLEKLNRIEANKTTDNDSRKSCFEEVIEAVGKSDMSVSDKEKCQQLIAGLQGKS